MSSRRYPGVCVLVDPQMINIAPTHCMSVFPVWVSGDGPSPKSLFMGLKTQSACSEAFTVGGVVVNCYMDELAALPNSPMQTTYGQILRTDNSSRVNIMGRTLYRSPSVGVEGLLTILSKRISFCEYRSSV